ncbi:hypothetical protein [Ramlibacter pallidus]|uniref:DUF2946 domain-containing protein n=1 Tax=Ramlibacter pallidus TaxID=2780087 RepID=A0ABR9S4Q3_9BURK|nr:hypothetical protein [Ramlibacter pallidus]MBE7367997.1 hypothetical protein [Ramlibacter pallidus]
MDAMTHAEKRRARWAFRGFALLAILIGFLLAGANWSALQRPDIAVMCQHEQTTSPQCKRTGLYWGLALMALGFPLLLVPAGWLNRNMRRSHGPDD